MAVVRLEYKDVKTHRAPYWNESSHLFNKGDYMLEFIVTWTAGLLIWANMLLWGFVIALVVLNLLIGLIMPMIPTVKKYFK